MLTKNSGLATSLLKALDVLSVLAINPEGIGMNDLRVALKQPRTSILRVLQTLQHYGLVEQGERKWRVTDRFHHWAAPDPAARLREQQRPKLEKLAAAVHELVVLGLVEGGLLRHIDYVEWEHQVVVRPGLGRRFPLECSAMGKLFLSQRPDLLSGVKSAERRQEIEQAGREGVAWNREETSPGVIAMAFWIESPSPLAAMVSITWPVFRYSEKSATEALRKARQLWPV